MVNQTVFVGRLVSIRENIIKLSVPDMSDPKNPEANVIIPVYCSDNIMDNTRKYAKVGEIICIKGHHGNFIDNDGKKKVVVVCTKLSLLSSKL